MKKFLFILILSLFATLAAAQEGCFLYKDSSLYCTPTPQPLAETECAFFDDCVIETSFTATSCNQLPECQTILCKSTCQQEFVGNCPAGEIPSAEQNEWCSPGCCLFNYAEQNYCDYSRNKWFCQTKSENRNAIEFSYELIDQQACAFLCGQPTEERISATENEDEEKVVPAVTDTNGLSPNILIGVLIIVAALAILHYLNTSRRLSREEETSETEQSLPTRLFSPFFTNPFKQRKISKLKQQRQHKQQHHQRESFLAEMGFAIPKEDDFTRLDRVVTRHQRGKEPRKEEKAMRKLQYLAKRKKLPQKPRKSRRARKRENPFLKLQRIIQQK